MSGKYGNGFLHPFITCRPKALPLESFRTFIVSDTGKLQKIGQQPVAEFSQHRLRMELDTEQAAVTMSRRHHCFFMFRYRQDIQQVRQILVASDERVISPGGKRRRNQIKKGMAPVGDF